MPKGVYKHKPWTEERKQKMSILNKSFRHTPESIEKIRIAAQKRGRYKVKRTRTISNETRKKLSIALKNSPLYARRGENNPRWKGGISSESMRIRYSMEYKLWRTAVYQRDNFTCVWCGAKNKLNADHILPFADYPALRLAIDNGRTLCVPCHRKRHAK